MNVDLLNAIAKYVIALVVVIGCFALIYVAQAGTDNTQPWSAISLIVGWLIRDSAANSSAANAAKIVAASKP